MNPAQAAREAKERHPEEFCQVENCLWRIQTSRGPNPCRKHPVLPSPDGGSTK